MLASEVAVVKSHHGISVKCSRYRDTGPTDPSLVNWSTTTNQILFQEWHSTSERPPYISLLEVKDKCFYLQTTWAFHWYFWFSVKTADNRDILSKYNSFKEILNNINKSLIVVVVDQFTPGYQFTPTLNFLEDLLFFIEKMFTTS